MRQKRVDHFGVHESENGMFYLIQDDEQNTRGLNVKSNIKVTTWRRGLSPHDIRLVSEGLLSPNDRRILSKLERDALGQLLLPRWDNAGKIVYISGTDLHFHESTSLGLLGITEPISQPAWLMTLGEARKQARVTNLAPYIIYDVNASWFGTGGDKIVNTFRGGTRPLILIGNSDVVLPNYVSRVTQDCLTDFKKIKSPLKEVGSIYLKELMKNAES